MGPLTYASAATDNFAWARRFSGKCYLYARMGPLEYGAAASNGLVWDHYYFLNCAADALEWAH
jgi:hypothetical protein